MRHTHLESHVKIIAPLFILLALVLGGCSKSDSKSASKSEPETTEKAEPKKEAGGHASHDVVPGSHEDWCGEHGVPESQCTRCNHDLEAAFKATGDWCEEHGLPESQCLKCNPDLEIERPAKK